MYTAYFGLSRKPFKPKDLKDYYRNVNFDAACADILDGIREKSGFILLTGEAGVGKTIVLSRCMAEASDIRFVRLIKADLDFPDILNYLCASLDLPIDGLDGEQQKQLLLDTLAAQARRNRTIALLVDDAQHLSDEVLLRFQEFVETPVLPSQRLQVVLVGLPEISSRLERPEFHQLRDSIRVRCQIDCLSPIETGLFINHQLKIAWWNEEQMLEPATIERIEFYCKGVPRAIAVLCDTVLLFASLQSEREITPTLVDEAAQSCFLGEKSKPNFNVHPEGSIAALETASASDINFDLDLSEFDFSFDQDQETMQAKGSEPAVLAHETTFRSERPPLAAEIAAKEPLATDQAKSVEAYLAEVGLSSDLSETVAAPTPANKPDSKPRFLPESPLDGFVQLLDQLVGKLAHRDRREKEALQYFLDRYLRLAQDREPAQTQDFRQQIARLMAARQPILVGLATAIKVSPEQDGVLCALLINPSWWLYREIRLRVRGTDLVFANDGRIAPLRLLDGRDAQVVFVKYQCPLSSLSQTLIWLELDLCDHRGQWTAYNSASQIRLEFLPQEGGGKAKGALGSARNDRFWPDSLTAARPNSAWLLAGVAASGATSDSIEPDAGGLVTTFPLELEADAGRTNSLFSTTTQTLGRGTPLTRALLLAADPSQAPARIELVSRPFIIFGRHSSTAGTGFGDFTLGFVPKYTRISRLHCVICALSDQLALMPASDVGRTYTGCNGRRLERGRWESLESEDILEICDLYRLKLTLAWERKWEPAPTGWNPERPREKFGNYLLDLVEILRQRDQQAGAEDLRKTLRQRYLNLLRVQDRVSQLNGVGNPGSLRYARFERDDAACRQVVHYYIPKWVSLGSSTEMGLRIEAEGVKPHHAELLYRDGMYWIQNLAEAGAVRIGYHDLAANEVLALEAGDLLLIGSARFTFEAY